MTDINLGLDFGSLSFRAGYMIDNTFVPVPSPIRESHIWRGYVLIEPNARGSITFTSLKHRLGSSAPYMNSVNASTDSGEELLAEILTGIHRSTAEYAGENIARLAVSVPSRYSENYRWKLVNACKLAGFTDVVLINDCSAAVLNYLNEDNALDSGTFLVYSMGQVGYEISLIRVGKQHNVREIGHEGDDQPSGGTFDAHIIRRLLAMLQHRGTPLHMMRQEHFFELREVATDIKQALATQEKIEVELLPSLTGTAGMTRLQVTRSEFLQLVLPDLDLTLEALDRLLQEHGITPQNVHCVLLVGGSTRISYIQERLAERFGKSKIVQPRDNALVRGAALFANNPDGLDVDNLLPSPTSNFVVADSQAEKTTSVSEIPHEIGKLTYDSQNHFPDLDELFIREIDKLEEQIRKFENPDEHSLAVRFTDYAIARLTLLRQELET